MSSPDRSEYDRLHAQGGVISLCDRTQLVLTGPDRVRYLNGQVTSDVRKLRPGQTQMACVTTAKGKLCADVCITAHEDALFVDAESSVRDALIARLERYIVADDVTISDATKTRALLHCVGFELPPLSNLAYVAAARRFGRDGWDVRAPREELDSAITGVTELDQPAKVQLEAFSKLTNGRKIVDTTLAEVLRIEAGVPRWGYELDENTLPPEAGLDQTHIDYHKGCYIGQEVISRLRSVGHVNRQLTGFVALGDTPLAAGMRLFASADDSASIGLLTSAVYSFALEKPIALGYLKRGSPTGALLARPDEANGPDAVVNARTLPFAP